MYNNYSKELNFLVLDNITAFLPTISFSSSNMNIPNNLNLADPVSINHKK
jgi:hypothetical protein